MGRTAVCTSSSRAGRPASGRARAGGFTLIEVLIAISVLALMMLIAWGTATQTMRAKRHFGAIQDRFREARSAMARIVADVEMAYISGNEDRTLNDLRTFFVGESSGEVNELRFSTFAHQRLYADANEGDQTIVRYYPAPDRDDRGKTNLMRRETRRLGNEKPETLAGEADILFSDVAKLKVSYFDVRANEWKDAWSTASVESQNKLPDRVRIQLTFLDDEEKEITLTTQAKVHVREMLQFFAN
jgi:general secretion pathway protein J